MSQIADQKLDKLSRPELELFKLRHTAEHVLHQAVKELYPSIQLAMGPATEDGFYFDFDPSPKGKQPVKISEEDFDKIEKRMQQIIDKNLPLIRQELTVKQAKQLFKGNPYKQEWLREINKRGEKVSVYWTGKPGEKDSMVDLCSGPHAKSTGAVKAFKLLSLAGAYWRGDEKNKMLTRIYGTAFASKKALDKYLWQIQEAKKRDHRKIGKQQNLFLISQAVGSGLPIFTPKGFIVRNLIENYIVQEKQKNGYQFVWTPHIAHSNIYRQSGHWQKYDAMFNPMKLDKEEYVLKPMNCPHHFQVYLSKPRSYKELPLRIAENGTCYRYEKTGELNGLLRVRSVTIDDTHTFIRLSQTNDEVNQVLKLILNVFKNFGFTDYKARISTRDPQDPNKYLGSTEQWERAEEALKRGAKNLNLDFDIGIGEAAFYGPKIDIMVKDSIGRQWQLSTVQLDYNQPNNFDMTYIDEHGQRVRPAVLHIAVLGSIERFMAVLIEHYAGAFPTWLAPVQAKIIPISQKHHSYAQKVSQTLSKAQIRCQLDIEASSMQKRIRKAEIEKIPYIIVVGNKEQAKNSVNLRQRGQPGHQNTSLQKLLSTIGKAIETKAQT